MAGVTRLMKLLFLADVEGGFKGDENFRFEPYKYGPFVADLYDDLRLLRDYDLLDMAHSNVPDFYQARELRDIGDPDVLNAARELGSGNSSHAPNKQWIFRLTPDGRRLAAKLRERLTPERPTRLAEIKARFNHVPLNELLTYVYERYPEWAQNSVHPLASRA